MQDAVIEVAEEHEVTPGEIAIACVASKGIFPNIAPLKVVQLMQSVQIDTRSQPVD